MRDHPVRDTYLEEVTFLRSCGASDTEILTRLDVTAAALSRTLYRADRPDLARPFARLASTTRRRATCLRCGTQRGPQRPGQTGYCATCRFIVIGWRAAS